MVTALLTQLRSESTGSSAEPSLTAAPRPSPQHSQYLGEGRLLLSSHLEPGSSWEVDQALAEAAGRPAPRTVPGPYRAGWDGRGLPVPDGCYRGGSWAGLPGSPERVLDKSKPKHSPMLKGREVASRGGEMGCPAPFPGVGEKPQPPSNLGLLGHQLPQSLFLLPPLTSS